MLQKLIKVKLQRGNNPLGPDYVILSISGSRTVEVFTLGRKVDKTLEAGDSLTASEADKLVECGRYDCSFTALKD